MAESYGNINWHLSIAADGASLALKELDSH